MGTLPPFNDPLAFSGLDAEALVERIVPREVAVTDQPSNDVTAVGVRDLFEAAHGCISCVCGSYGFFFLPFFFSLVLFSGRFEGFRPAGSYGGEPEDAPKRCLYIYIYIPLAFRVGNDRQVRWGGRPAAPDWLTGVVQRAEAGRKNGWRNGPKKGRREARSGSACKQPRS